MGSDGVSRCIGPACRPVWPAVCEETRRLGFGPSPLLSQAVDGADKQVIVFGAGPSPARGSAKGIASRRKDAPVSTPRVTERPRPRTVGTESKTGSTPCCAKARPGTFGGECSDLALRHACSANKQGRTCVFRLPPGRCLPTRGHHKATGRPLPPPPIPLPNTTPPRPTTGAVLLLAGVLANRAGNQLTHKSALYASAKSTKSASSTNES